MAQTSRTYVAFTLVETLLVVAVIAVLVAIIAPSLAKARQFARVAACFSNLRQCAVAWNAYDADHGVFPYGDDLDYWKESRIAWGGDYWYAGQSPPTPSKMGPIRPLNPYLGAEKINQQPLDVVRCPSDTGVVVAANGAVANSSIAAYSLAPSSIDRTSA